MIVRYQWSEDGESELCEKSIVILKQNQRCYHCDKMMSVGEKAVQLIAQDGERYFLHETCAELGTR